jgi:succinoglycan biosynthesis transport protein ExoP
MDKLPDSAGLRYPEHQFSIDSFSTKEEIDKLIGIVRRQYPIMVFILACAIALSLVYLFTTPKQYTAHAMFLIDTARMRALMREPKLYEDQPALDDAQVETEIEVLKSEQIGLSVVKDLKLTEDPEFVGSRTGLVDAVLALIFSPFSSGVAGSHGAASENALTRTALGEFLSNRDIKRVTTTYVLDISYTSPSPGRAAAVANAIADAYLVGQLDAKYQASSRVGKWLQDRIAELRQQAMSADRAVLEFKEQKNIVDTGGVSGGGGARLLVDQRVVDLNSQLAKARADTAEAKARLDRIQVVMTQEVPDAAVADSMNSTIISALRTQYLDYDRRYQVYKTRYGPTHLAVVALQTQMTELRRSMADELGRIGEVYKSNYEIAKSREASLEKSLAQQISGAQLTNRDQLGLAELESRAKAYHASHDSFIQRYMEVTEQQSLPTTDARVITAATPPGGASSPRTSRILLVTGVLGLMLSFGAAWLRESIDRVFRTTKQVEQILNATCLTVLPVVKNFISPAATADGAQHPVAKRLRSAREFDPKVSGLDRHVIDQPMSAFAEGFRSIKVAADISGSIKKNKVVGITSSLPREGKSTVASNFAELIAHAGRKVILIDGDLRNPTLSHRLASKADVGLLEVLAGKIELRDAIYTDSLSGLAFLPAVIEPRLAHSSEILASEVLRQLIDGLRKSYDYIIVDLPPLAPVVDARATTNIIDSYVFVIEWGRTRINMVQRQLGSAPEIFDRLLGVVLNKANVRILDRYEDYYGSNYYKKNYYARYGYTK